VDCIFLILDVAKCVQIVERRHGLQRRGEALRNIEDVIHRKIVLFLADEDVGTCHQRDAINLPLNATAVKNPRENLACVNDIRQLVEIALVDQVGHNDCIITIDVTIVVRLIVVTVPAAEFKRTCVPTVTEPFLELFAKIIRVRKIKIIIYNYRCVVEKILNICHTHTLIS
jgi:hypothetical protein